MKCDEKSNSAFLSLSGAPNIHIFPYFLTVRNNNWIGLAVGDPKILKMGKVCENNSESFKTFDMERSNTPISVIKVNPHTAIRKHDVPYIIAPNESISMYNFEMFGPRLAKGNSPWNMRTCTNASRSVLCDPPCRLREGFLLELLLQTPLQVHLDQSLLLSNIQDARKWL